MATITGRDLMLKLLSMEDIDEPVVFDLDSVRENIESTETEEETDEVFSTPVQVGFVTGRNGEIVLSAAKDEDEE